MKRLLIYTISLLLPVGNTLLAQDSYYGPLFQTVLGHNPAYAGSEGDGVVRTLYMNHYPGNNYNLHSVYLSYDSYFPLLHGGAGFFITDDYLGGIINDVKGGLSYSYFIQAGKDLFINAGLSVSVFHRGYNFGNAVFPDQIDPIGGVIFPTAENTGTAGKTAFDAGAGLVINYLGMFGGFSVSHLTQPDISEAGLSVDRLKRRYNVELAGILELGKSKNAYLRPVAFGSFQDGYLSASGGAVFEISNLSLNSVVLWDNGKSFDLQTGFTVSFADITLFYNYRFNMISGDEYLPLSLMHQTGLSVRLNKSEKRNNISTIILPKL